MKSKLFALIGILFLAGPVFAGQDRFGNSRYEIPRTSFTLSSDRNVIIASAGVTQWESGYGAIMIRSIDCSGVNPSTITVFNSIVFDGASSTAAIYQYNPSNGKTDGFYGSVFISSALSYDKLGTAPCMIGWDYTTIPKFGGVGTGN